LASTTTFNIIMARIELFVHGGQGHSRASVGDGGGVVLVGKSKPIVTIVQGEMPDISIYMHA
jgi:hypothetical protein